MLCTNAVLENWLQNCNNFLKSKNIFLTFFYAILCYQNFGYAKWQNSTMSRYCLLTITCIKIITPVMSSWKLNNNYPYFHVKTKVLESLGTSEENRNLILWKEFEFINTTHTLLDILLLMRKGKLRIRTRYTFLCSNSRILVLILNLDITK